MTSVAVNPMIRSHGWNIELLIAPGDVPFAGVFQPAKDVFMSFRDIINEMRLSFEFKDESSDVWNEVAFGLLDMLNITEGECLAPKFIQADGLDQPVPALPELEPEAPEDRVILQYRVFKHKDCGLPPGQPPRCHFEAGCAHRISKPVRRLEPRYLPPKKASSDPRYATYPLRKMARGRKPASPSKRSASGSVSPRKDPDIDQADEDFANMVAPPECNISDERAKTTMANFRSSCLTSAKQCAVTGMGRSWCDSPTIGPALQACHIVSQLQYHTYPDPEADPDEAQNGSDIWASPRRLEQAWERTWAPENGILLFSHLHDMFDQRLFSIHPETLQVRVFMPYDILLAYHGRKAKVQRRVDRAALRHHYDMCCIENMAAKMPFVEQLRRTESAASTSGINTPLEIRHTLAGIASPRILASPSEQNEGQDGQRSDGDPSKRGRQSEKQHMLEPSDCIDSSASASNKPMDDSSTSPDLSWSRKRKREHDVWIAGNHDSCLTPYNCDEFLADVSWELTKVARRRKWGTRGT